MKKQKTEDTAICCCSAQIAKLQNELNLKSETIKKLRLEQAEDKNTIGDFIGLIQFLEETASEFNSRLEFYNKVYL